MKRILFIAPDITVKGGVSAVIETLMEELSRNKDVKASLYHTYIEGINPVLRIIYSLFRFFCFVFIPFKYHVFYLHVGSFGSFYRKSLYSFYLKLLKKPVVLHVHAPNLKVFLESNNFNRKLSRRVFNLADKIYVLSRNMYQIVNNYCDNQNIEIIPNPIQMVEKNILKKRDSNDKVKILFLGEIGERKGVFDLVKGVAQMTEQQKNKISINICGNKEIKKLETMIEENNLENVCIVHGWVEGEKKKDLLGDSDIFILPSYYEGVPIAILEAMCYSLPIISTNIAGIPDIVRNQRNGIIIEPGDIQGIISSILQMVETPGLIEEFGENSRKFIGEHDVSIIANKIAKDLISLS